MKVKRTTPKILVPGIMLLFCLGSVYAAPCGDVNSDGSIDIVDALLIAQYYVGSNPQNFDAAAADVNESGGVDIVDALLIAQYYVGLGIQLYCPGATTVPTPAPTVPAGGDNTMGYCGCSMAQNVADGYRSVGGRRMWGGYGTGGMVVQNWTDTNSSSWQLFDQQSAQYGKPTAVWIQICIFASAGATYDEVKRIIANAREHAAPGATIYITGQPLYPEGNVCTLAGSGGPELTDSLAQQAGNDSSQNVSYSGIFTLLNSETSDGCHANSAGQTSLGNQAVEKWGQ